MFGVGLDHAQEARLELARVVAQLGHTDPIPLPDVSTKAKAQEYIGIDLEERQREKNEFLRVVVPEWLQRAEERHRQWDAGERDIVPSR